MSSIVIARLLRVGTSSSIVRSFHTTTFRFYPRGVKQLPDANHEKWSEYVAERRETFTPLHKEYGTTFGSVRFDKDNEPYYTGQLDDIEEAFSKSTDRHVDSNELSSEVGNAYTEIDPRASTKHKESYFSKPGTGLFVEDLDNLKPIRVLEIHMKEKPTSKFKDFSSSKVSHTKAVLSNDSSSMNEIDSQYFNTLTDLSTLNNSSLDAVNPHLLHQEKLINVDSNQVPEDNDLNFFDQQLLGEYPQQTKQTNVFTNDFLNPENLEDLNYFDKQMIFGEPNAKIHPEPHDTPRETRKDERRSKKGQRKFDNEVSNEKDEVFTQPRNKTFKPIKGSALEFVKKIRQKYLENPKPDLKSSKTREEFVSEIGVSMDSRIQSATNTKKNLINKSVLIQDSNDEVKNVSGKLDARFLPEDLSKLTSVEVERIFVSNIIYDDNDVVAIFKPYGIPMFGDSNHVSHSVEKYQNALCSATKADTLYEVHRLDKTTCGILLFAKTPEMHAKLKRLFRERKVVKTYWALLNGTPNPSEGIINIPLQEQCFSDNRYRINLCPDLRGNGMENAKISRRFKGSDVMPAVTSFRTLAVSGNTSLVEVNPTTGFKHQIRSHLGLGLGCPVLGDHKYSYMDTMGKPQKVHGDILNRLGVRFSKSRDLPIYLVAKKIRIPEIIPDKNLVIEAKLPHYFNRTMKRLKVQPLKKH